MKDDKDQTEPREHQCRFCGKKFGDYISPPTCPNCGCGHYETEEFFFSHSGERCFAERPKW